MENFENLNAIAVPFDEENIDTNQLCPTRFNKVPEGPQYARILFHDLRFNRDGSEKPDFILNQGFYREAKIIVANRNFGCGSSRESAVWALNAFGIRALIAPSFGDIFYNNCFKNGLLPIVLADQDVLSIRRQLHGVVGARITVDLESQIVISADGKAYSFEINSLRRKCLLKGLDDISLTQRFRHEIEAFEKKYYTKTSWLMTTF